jgi:hypothetical protein
VADVKSRAPRRASKRRQGPRRVDWSAKLNVSVVAIAAAARPLLGGARHARLEPELANLRVCSEHLAPARAAGGLTPCASSRTFKHRATRARIVRRDTSCGAQGERVMNGMRWRFPLFGLAVIVATAKAVRADECVVRGEHVVLESVVVRSGDVPVVVDLAGTSAQARIGVGRGAPHTVEVTDAIVFKGTRRNIWYTLARPLTVAHGMVELDAGAKVVNARARGAGVTASVVMSADDVLPGEDKAPDEIIQVVDLPCAALTLDEPGTDEQDDGDTEGLDSAGGNATWWRQRRAALRGAACGTALEFGHDRGHDDD